ncbi:MAG TPA: site-specific integrase [Gemmatimonadaceae bacterium]|nr:site-specific integrase [Gemmatimonadaceae bacterium]
MAALLRDGQVADTGVLTLSHLWERFSAESPAFLDNTPRTRAEDAMHVQILIAFFGKGCDVRNLTEADVIAFTAKRMRGGIDLGDGELSKPVRARSPEVELRILRTMLKWATTIRVRGGQRLLAANPLAGVRSQKEQNPKRPVASFERFQAIRKAMQELAAQNAESPSKHQRWLRLELALVLAEATGRRIGSIRKLAWSDFDFDAATILWRAENDKKRKEWRVPMPPSLVEEVTRFRVKLGGAFGGLVFPAPTDPSKPLGREIFQHGLADAATHAKLSAVGMGWHSFRRKWASERKHHPQSDVLAAGGWSPKSASVLTECYQFADNETMLAVMSEQRKVSERAVGT